MTRALATVGPKAPPVPVAPSGPQWGPWVRTSDVVAIQPPAMSYDSTDSVVPDPFGAAGGLAASTLQGSVATLIAGLMTYAQQPLATIGGDIPIKHGRGKNARYSNVHAQFTLNNGHLLGALAIWQGLLTAAAVRRPFEAASAAAGAAGVPSAGMLPMLPILPHLPFLPMLPSEVKKTLPPTGNPIADAILRAGGWLA